MSAIVGRLMNGGVPLVEKSSVALGMYQIETRNNEHLSSCYFESDEAVFIIKGDVYKYNDAPLTKGQLFNKVSKGIDDLLNIFSGVDGYFSCVIYSKETKDTYIITDRWGMSPMYINKSDDKIMCWSTCLKNIVAKSSVKLSYDKEAIMSYIENSHFLSDRTHYEKIKRVKPASIIKIDKVGIKISEVTYWKWSNIKPINISFTDAVDRLYELFINSVDIRVSIDKHYCLTLSGGLDSRALVAAVHRLNRKNITCLSFGIPDSPDLAIAAEVSRRAGYKHEIVDININNWIEGREKGVSNSGGMKSIFHMHVMNAQKSIEDVSKYVINGFLGDLVLGGGYLRKNAKGFVTSEELLKSKFGYHNAQVDCSDSYFESASTDPIFIYNRGVRFTSMGSDIVADTLINIKPFMDNRLIEFIYSLNDEYRYNGKLYQSMLLKYFPEFFSDIPWQSTGKLIKSRAKDSAMSEMYLKLRPKLISLINHSSLNRIVRSIHRKVVNSDTFVDYNSWIESEGFKLYLELLLNKKSFVKGILGNDMVDKYINDAILHKKIEPLGCLISLELFLQSVRKK